jgi:hypothetical protein
MELAQNEELADFDGVSASSTTSAIEVPVGVETVEI